MFKTKNFINKFIFWQSFPTDFLFVPFLIIRNWKIRYNSEKTMMAKQCLHFGGHMGKELKWCLNFSGHTEKELYICGVNIFVMVVCKAEYGYIYHYFHLYFWWFWAGSNYCPNFFLKCQFAKYNSSMQKPTTPIRSFPIICGNLGMDL